MKISIVGTGYVGLVSGTCLAACGHHVTCVDIKPEVVDQINSGSTPIYEIDLDPLLAKVVKSGNLTATTDLQLSVLESEVTLICVGTPTVGSEADLSQILNAAKAIGTALSKKSSYHVVVVKSTVLPGTSEGKLRVALEEASGIKLGNGWGLCMNPEFLREGRAVEDFNCPDRIVIGASDERAAHVLLDMYEHFDCPKIVTTPKTAEMIKYVANSLFAAMISFSNEIANLCSTFPGIDAREVWKGVHSDRRLTPVKADRDNPPGVVEYLWHGLGFGGSCFPKDVAALRGFGEKAGVPTAMLDAILAINALQPMRMVSLLEREMNLPGKTVAVLGLAFKPGTDDLRYSPALVVVEALRERGARVVVHDPIAMPGAQRNPVFEEVLFAQDWETALRSADACCIITSWPDYRVIQPSDFMNLMKQPLVIDGRGLFDPYQFSRCGVKWRGIGYTPEA